MIGPEQVLPAERRCPEMRDKGPVGIFIACGAVKEQGAVSINDEAGRVAAFEEWPVARLNTGLKDAFVQWIRSQDQA